jgi:hypothetical protein
VDVLQNPMLDRFRDTLGRMVRAARACGSVRVALLTTQDRDHALAVLAELSGSPDVDTPLHHATVVERRRFDRQQGRWDPVGAGSPDPSEILRQASQVGHGIVVVEDAVALLRDDGGDRTARMTCAQLLAPETRCGGVAIVFLEPPGADSHLPGTLAPQFVRLDLGLPGIPELGRLAREEVAAAMHLNGGTMELDELREGADRLAPCLVGLTRSTARDMLRDGLHSPHASWEMLLGLLSDAKAAHLGRELAMAVLDTENAEEPIGLEYLVEYLEINRARAVRYGPDRARGVLLVGPPGTGKTMLARSLGGRVLCTPVVEFRVSSLMNSLLGETERRFTAAFATLAAMAPNVVFIDELEKVFGDSSERDGGTMMRCTGALLSWLSDNQAPNFIMATANDLTRMGQVGMTMTRSERFDAAFFVDVPGREARRRMLERWLAGMIADHEGAAGELARLTERFSGADLRSVVKKASATAEHRGKPLSIEGLFDEVERKRSRALSLYEEFRALRRWGSLHCEPAGPTGD